MKTVFLDTNVISFLRNSSDFKNNPEKFGQFVEKLSVDFDMIYISDIVLDEIVQGEDENGPIERVQILLKLQEKFKGQLVRTHSLQKILKTEQRRKGKLKKTPFYDSDNTKKYLEKINDKDLLKSAGKNLVYNHNEEFDPSLDNYIGSKDLRAKILTGEVADHLKAFKEFRGLKPTKYHRLVATEAGKISGALFNKMVRSDRYQFFKTLANLTWYSILRSAVHPNNIDNKRLVRLDENDSTDMLILVEAFPCDVFLVADKTLKEITDDVHERGLVKCKAIYLLDYLK